jgi:hypothetical protein
MTSAFVERVAVVVALASCGTLLPACGSRELPGDYHGQGSDILMTSGGPSSGRHTRTFTELKVTGLGDGKVRVSIGPCSFDGTPNGEGQALLRGACAPGLMGFAGQVPIGSGVATVSDQGWIDVTASGHTDVGGVGRVTYATRFMGKRRR